jgi:tetratricopeptide (TPR) repeat protein
MTLGNIDESLRELARSQDLDPAAPDMGSWLLVMARRYDEAIQQSRMRIEQDPNSSWTHMTLGLAYGQKGQFDLAIGEGEKATKLDNSPLLASVLAHSYAMAGRQDKAQSELAVIKDAIKRRYACAYEVGVVYVALHRNDEAFRWFEAAYDARSNCMVWMKVDPRLDSIRSDPRYKDLLQRTGLPQ